MRCGSRPLRELDEAREQHTAGAARHFELAPAS
jgi:hypothetical protein